jgi:antitoxin HicB
MKTGKDLNYYKGLHYKMVIDYDADEEVYVVRFPHLPGCIMHAETAEEAVRLGLQVKGEWLELAFRKGWTIPEPPADLEMTGRLTLRLPKSLHKKVIDRAEGEGVSQNQLILSFIAEGLGKAETEDFLKIAAKQDEMISLFKAGQAVTAYPYSSGFLYNFLPAGGAVTVATATGATMAATIETTYSLGTAMVGEMKEGLRVAKPKAIGAFEENNKGGYANAA